MLIELHTIEENPRAENTRRELEDSGIDTIFASSKTRLSKHHTVSPEDRALQIYVTDQYDRWDKPAPKDTGITKDYKTAEAFEKRPMNKAAVVAELEKSFAFLRTSMDATTDAQLDTTIDMFGQKSTARGLWISTATHMHEHLGQLIAYARSNKITPPWSK